MGARDGALISVESDVQISDLSMERGIVTPLKPLKIENYISVYRILKKRSVTTKQQHTGGGGGVHRG